MAQKLGFFLTKPATSQKQGTYANLIDESEEPRELTEEEKECITSLTEVMEKTGSDFTDTYRNLGEVQANGTNIETITENMVAICAPIKLLDKKDQSRYSPAELAKLEEILNRSPEMLRFYGIDPDDAREEVQKAKERKNKKESEPSLEERQA